MRVSDIAKIMQKAAPIELAEAWDNVGLIIGDHSALVSGVVISVDLTDSAIDMCLQNGCNMIITHHPPIFEGLRRLIGGNRTADLVAKCIKNNINVYSAHTNMDKAECGINATFAELLGLTACNPTADLFGVIGDFCGDLQQLLQKVCNITGETQPKVCMSSGAELLSRQKVAFSSGSGGRSHEAVSFAAAANVTTFISSEFKHDIILDLLAQGISVIQIGHFESESIFVQIVYKLLSGNADNIFMSTSIV